MMLNGIRNFLQIINDNWVTICVILGLIVSLYTKIKNYIGKSDEEKIAIAKKQIQETMLKMITTAEIDFADWNEAGEIKRAQVVSTILEAFPVISRVTNQEEIISFIDEQINESLKTLRKIVKENTKSDGQVENAV